MKNLDKLFLKNLLEAKILQTDKLKPINTNDADNDRAVSSDKLKNEKLIASQPKLRHIMKTLELLRSEEGPDGEKLNWKELSGLVKPFNSAMELSDNVRQTVVEYLAKKIPKIKEKIPRFEDITDLKLIDALANNWFEGDVDEAISGQRREILLMVMAQIVKRIETKIYLDILKNAGPADLEKIGLAEDYRDLLAATMDVSTKANPLFVRFSAYTQLSPSPPEKASPTALYVPADKNFHTLASLFPHETKYLANKYSELANNDQKWVDKPGGKIFKQFLIMQAQLFSETDPKLAENYQNESAKLYGELVASGFPVLITPALEGYRKPPYLDPELRVCLASADAREQESSFQKAQTAMAESLTEVNAGQYNKEMKSRLIRSVISLGGNGVDLTFNAVAQDNPAILLYLNEQIRAYDKNFPKFMDLITNTDQEFAGLPETERVKLMEEISRTDTVLHELGHSVVPDKSRAAKRLGPVQSQNMSEVKAENIYRALIPTLVEKSGLKGTKEQWGVGLLASAVQILQDQSEGDPYYYASVYSLNNLFKQGAIEFQENKITVKDFNRYYEINKTNALEIMELYQDNSANEKKAEQWINKNCQPNQEVKKLIEFIKQANAA